MKKQVNLKPKEKLFNPNYTFVGNTDIVLKGYPKRSYHLERYADFGVDAKRLNPKFIKDGYMYLLRGAKNGQESGFYSQQYTDKNTIESLNLDPNFVAKAQIINGNTPFISATTNIYVAASFSNCERIYILKLPVDDVYTFSPNTDEVVLLKEEEYMIPDYISKEEIIRSFRYDKFKQIYSFLQKEIGLDITPEDLGEMNDIQHPDMKRINMEMYFNTAGESFDSILSIIQDAYLEKKLPDKVVHNFNSGKEKKSVGRQVAIFTDSHALLEPVEAILKDIKSRDIKEIYSLGDNIGLGPNPCEVVDLLSSYNVISLQGNYEDMVHFGTDPFLIYLREDQIKNIQWTKSKLREDQVRSLRLSPHSIHLQIGDQNTILCHFANDVRCDFMMHDSWEYKQRLDMNVPAYSQFYYTNSVQQFMEIAFSLGMKQEMLLGCTTLEEMLKRIREYIKLNRDQLDSSLNGYLSYCDDPLFYEDNKLLTISDYDAVIQGHVHFNSKEFDEKTWIYTLRAVGMGYTEGTKNLAQYAILSETDGEMKVQTVDVPYDRESMEFAINHCDLPNSIIKQYTLTK